MKWTDELDGEFNGNPCKIRVGVSETYSESDYNKNLREQRVNNVVKDYGNFDRPKVGGVSADDLMNDSVPSFRESFINALIHKREVELLYYCRCQLVDIITMIDVANTADDLNLELLKALVGDIKNVFGDKL